MDEHSTYYDLKPMAMSPAFLIKNLFKDSLFVKNCLSLFILVFMSFGVFANPHLASREQIGMFKNSKTCVVLENSIGAYNFYIKDAVQKYWKSTEFEFIDTQEFEKRRHDSKYSFLVLMKSVYDNDPSGVSYNNINLVLGDPAYDMTDMPEFCSIPLSYSQELDTDCEFAIPAIIKFIQIHLKNLDRNRFLISLNGLKYYHKTVGFKNKVLLLNREMLAGNADSPEKINTVYPYYIKILSSAEILKELVIDQKNTLILFHVGPSSDAGAGKCFEMIFDTEGNLCYYNYRMVTNDNEDGFNLNDFKHIR
jgi:hypothetical protein